MAAYDGYIHVVRLCHNYDNVNLDKVIVWAAESGHEEAFVSRIWSHPSQLGYIKGRRWWSRNIMNESVPRLGCYLFCQFMAWPADAGHENIVQLCHEWGDTNVDKAMVFAACKSHKFIVC